MLNYQYEYRSFLSSSERKRQQSKIHNSHVNYKFVEKRIKVKETACGIFIAVCEIDEMIGSMFISSSPIILHPSLLK